MSTSQRRLAAIMFTDMVGYSARAQANEADALSTLQDHNALLRSIFAQHHGREIKTIGDAFLVEFDSALEAAQCALAVQQALHERNAGVPESQRVQVRIGLHLGDVVRSNGDVLGDAVNIASRIERLSEPGGISVTQQVYDQVQNKLDATFARLPPVSLKNIRVPIGVYRIVVPWEAPSARGRGTAGSLGRQLAVLPLANISPDPHDEYFADGLTEELISVLSQVPGLSVIARTSVLTYKTAPKSIAEVGNELGVDSVLEGSVRKDGQKIRITLQLIDVATQRHVWANTYNRELNDVFEVQSDVAQRTADALRLEIEKTEPASSRKAPTANLEAYELYLKGLAAAGDHEKNRTVEAVRAFERATQLDSKFAEAYASWAQLYVRAAGDYLSFREAIPRARELAARALALDPDSAEAHAALGNIAMQYDHDWSVAEREFREAIKLNPSNANAYTFFGLMLIALERFDEAKELLGKVVRLDPGGNHEGTLAWAKSAAGDSDAGTRHMMEHVADNPNRLGPHTMLGLVSLELGRRGDAIREADCPILPADETERFDHALLNALVGRPAVAREIIAESLRGEPKSYTSDTHLAMLYAALDEREKALNLLEKEFREGDPVLSLSYRGVFFDSIREDPRFIELLSKYGVPSHPIRRPNASTG
ncbi:MAG: adenylate/guanylate cyclase domain-containing protein [Thermoplasmata archaeon]